MLCMGEMRIRNVPDELHWKFKALCAEKGITMNDYLLEFIKKEVEKREKEKL